MTAGTDYLPSTGAWNKWYEGRTERTSYGDDTTYKLGAEYLGGLFVEDWGCGLGHFSTFMPSGRVRGIDGSNSKFADVVTDLATYDGVAEGIFMRHVLEHDVRWREILRNAVRAFTVRAMVVLFTPWSPMDEDHHVIADNDMGGRHVPDLALPKMDVQRIVQPVLVRIDKLSTRTQYGVEHVLYLEKTP